MDFFKYFHFGLKRKYKYLLVGVFFAFLIFNLLSLFGYCATYDGVVNGVNIDVSNNVIIEGSNNIRYIKLLKGHKYRITNPQTSSRYCAFTKTVPDVGVSLLDLHIVTAQTTFDILANEDYFLMLNSAFEYEDLGVQDFKGVMWSLNDTLSTDNIWTSFRSTISYIYVVVIICFGYLIISKSIDKFFINR